MAVERTRHGTSAAPAAMRGRADRPAEGRKSADPPEPARGGHQRDRRKPGPRERRQQAGDLLVDEVVRRQLGPGRKGPHPHVEDRVGEREPAGPDRRPSEIGVKVRSKEPWRGPHLDPAELVGAAEFQPGVEPQPIVAEDDEEADRHRCAEPERHSRPAAPAIRRASGPAQHGRGDQQRHRRRQAAPTAEGRRPGCARGNEGTSPKILGPDRVEGEYQPQQQERLPADDGSLVDVATTPGYRASG